LYFFLAKPKSPILAWPFDIMILAGFRSLKIEKKLPMNNSLPNKGQKPITNLLQNGNGLFLIDFVLLFQQALKVTITKLLNNIVVMWTFHNIIQGDNIFRLDSLKNLYLWEESGLHVIIRIDWDKSKAYWTFFGWFLSPQVLLICLSLLYKPSLPKMYCTVGSFAQKLVHVNRVSAYFLLCHFLLLFVNV
jgi:hypothetical protein